MVSAVMIVPKILLSLHPTQLTIVLPCVLQLKHTAAGKLFLPQKLYRLKLSSWPNTAWLDKQYPAGSIDGFYG